MNSKMIITLLAIVVTSMAFAQPPKVQKATFKVYGNCGQCKDRIEAALDVKGVKSAEWNIETKQLDVVYVPTKISIEQIHALLAKAGHDTELAKADGKVYGSLPECCMYREHPNTHKE